ncbi:MAG: hypothetical protein ACAH83_04355 [Alphaproteobacteria bacterium]
MSLKQKLAKIFRYATGRYNIQDVEDYTVIWTRDYYDRNTQKYTHGEADRHEGAWDVRIFHGKDKRCSYSNPDDVLANGVPLPQALSLLEQFEEQCAGKQLKRCRETAVRPTPNKVRRALGGKGM